MRVAFVTRAEKAGAWAGSAGTKSTEICPSRQYAEQYDLLIDLVVCSGRVPALRIIGPPSRDQTKGIFPLCDSNGDAHRFERGAIEHLPCQKRLKKKAAIARKRKAG